MCLEFRRRLDPDLQFYYYNTSHERFVEGELPPFSEKADKPRKSQRPLEENNLRLRLAVRLPWLNDGQGPYKHSFITFLFRSHHCLP